MIYDPDDWKGYTDEQDAAAAVVGGIVVVLGIAFGVAAAVVALKLFNVI